MERRWVIVQLRLVVWILFEGSKVFIHPSQFLSSFICLLLDDTQACLSFMSIDSVPFSLDFLMYLAQGFEAPLVSVFMVILVR